MIKLLLGAILFILCSVIQAKPTEIVLWHSLAGFLGEEVIRLTDEFNQSQYDVLIKPVYKGDYIESLTSFAAVFRAGTPPALIQVFEVGTSIMLSKNVTKPVDELMHQNKLSLPLASFFPSLREYYSEEGHLMAMPFNSSVPVMFYNTDALKSVGYASSSFPNTWEDFEILASKLKSAGFSCTYTSAYPAWILIESFIARHGLLTKKHRTDHTNYHHPRLIHHLERLRRWQVLNYFVFGGRVDDAMFLFISGKCPILSQSSGAYHQLQQTVDFPVGIASMPVDSDMIDHVGNNVVGGAALWVVENQTPEVYRGIAKFFAYLATPAVQYRWHERTGYLPLGVSGVYEPYAKAKAYPLLNIAKSELQNTSVSLKTAPIDAQNQIRSINDEALEEIFAGLKTPDEAIIAAGNRAKLVTKRFRKITVNRKPLALTKNTE